MPAALPTKRQKCIHMDSFSNPSAKLTELSFSLIESDDFDPHPPTASARLEKTNLDYLEVKSNDCRVIEVNILNKASADSSKKDTETIVLKSERFSSKFA